MQRAENERINGIQKSRLAEIEDWKSKYTALQQTVSLFETLEKDKRSIEERFGHKIRENEELNFKINNLEQELATIRNNESSFREIERNNMSLTKEIERLNGILKSQSG